MMIFVCSFMRIEKRSTIDIFNDDFLFVHLFLSLHKMSVVWIGCGAGCCLLMVVCGWFVVAQRMNERTKF